MAFDDERGLALVDGMVIIPDEMRANNPRIQYDDYALLFLTDADTGKAYMVPLSRAAFEERLQLRPLPEEV